MKLKVPLEDIRKGDRINGKKVVEVLHRDYARYVRLILEDGRDVIDGYMGQKIEIERPVN